MIVMEEKFFDTIERYMLPIDAVERVIDSTYFLRKNLGFAFAQGYCHPQGGFYGKLINYPDPRGALEIFGRRYSNTNKRVVDGRLELIPIDEQLRLNHLVEPALAGEKDLPLFADHHARFDLADCIGFFDHKRSLKAAMEMYPWLSPTIQKVGGFIGMAPGSLGVTGSLAYGRMDEGEEDVDLTICGSVEENWRAIRKITEWVKDPAHRVVEFGKFWPMRFYYEGTLICPFFIYGRADEIPLRDFTMDLVKSEVLFRGRVRDDRHSIYLPMVMGMEEVDLDGVKESGLPLIVYDSSVRGEYRCGDWLEGRGRLVNVRKPNEEFRALLVTNSTAIAKRDRV
jgi:predicted nucleotidyltransferase